MSRAPNKPMSTPSSAAQPKSAAATAASLPTVEAKPTADQVRVRAYELYLARKAKSLPGDARSDWINAELELTRCKK